MKGTVLKSFVATIGARKVRGVGGEIVDIPRGVDWVKAGLVAPLEAKPEEKPPAEAPEAAGSSGQPTEEDLLMAMPYGDLRDMAKALGLSLPAIGLSKNRLVEMLLLHAREQKPSEGETSAESKDASAPETASMEPPENAMLPQGQPRVMSTKDLKPTGDE